MKFRASIIHYSLVFLAITILAFMTLEMIPVSVHKGISPLGASAVASRHGEGAFEPSIRLGVEEDEAGLDSANQIMKRAVELVQLVKKNE